MPGCSGSSPGHPNGQLVRENYPGFALASALIMAFAILVSALGTHGEIKRLPQSEERARQLLGRPFQQSWARRRRTAPS